MPRNQDEVGKPVKICIAEVSARFFGPAHPLVDQLGVGFDTMSTRNRCAGCAPERGDMLRRCTDGGNNGSSGDSDDSVNEIVAEDVAVLASDRVWLEIKGVPYVEVSETFSMGADEPACEIQRTDNRTAECGACGKELGLNSYNGRACNMHAVACAREQAVLGQRAARAKASVE